VTFPIDSGSYLTRLGYPSTPKGVHCAARFNVIAIRCRVKRRAGGPALRPSLLGLYQISLGRYTSPLTFSEEELFFSVPLSPDSPFLVVVSAFVPPLLSVE
jgi:hypothetical protein